MSFSPSCSTHTHTHTHSDENISFPRPTINRTPLAVRLHLVRLICFCCQLSPPTTSTPSPLRSFSVCVCAGNTNNGWSTCQRRILPVVPAPNIFIEQVKHIFPDLMAPCVKIAGSLSTNRGIIQAFVTYVLQSTQWFAHKRIELCWNLLNKCTCVVKSVGFVYPCWPSNTIF